MRLMSLLFTAFLVAAPAWAAQQPSSSAADQKPRTDDKQPADQQRNTPDQQPTTNQFDLPVSLDKIKEGLAQPKPTLSLTTTDVKPTFRVQILERQKIEELLATLNFKTTPAPAGGLYW